MNSQTILLSFSLTFLLFLNACAMIPFEDDLHWDDPLAYSQSAVGQRAPHRPETYSSDLRSGFETASKPSQRKPSQHQEQLQGSLRQAAVDQTIQQGDVAPGMSMSQVRKAWGSPQEVQLAGDPRYGNAKWVYFEGLSSRWSLGRTRAVYFENGRVVGWESSAR